MPAKSPFSAPVIGSPEFQQKSEALADADAEIVGDDANPLEPATPSSPPPRRAAFFRPGRPTPVSEPNDDDDDDSRAPEANIPEYDAGAEPSAETNIPSAESLKIAGSTAEFLLTIFGSASNEVVKSFGEIDEAAIARDVEDGQLPEHVLDDVRALNAINAKEEAFTKEYRSMLRDPLVRFCQVSGIKDIPPGWMLTIVLVLVVVLMGRDAKKREREKDTFMRRIMDKYAKVPEPAPAPAPRAATPPPAATPVATAEVAADMPTPA